MGYKLIPVPGNISGYPTIVIQAISVCLRVITMDVPIEAGVLLRPPFKSTMRIQNSSSFNIGKTVRSAVLNGDSSVAMNFRRSPARSPGHAKKRRTCKCRSEFIAVVISRGGSQSRHHSTATSSGGHKIRQSSTTWAFRNLQRKRRNRRPSNTLKMSLRQRTGGNRNKVEKPQSMKGSDRTGWKRRVIFSARLSVGRAQAFGGSRTAVPQRRTRKLVTASRLKSRCQQL